MTFVTAARLRAALVTMTAVIAFGLLAGSGFLETNRASAQEAASYPLYRAMKNANIRTKPSKNGGILITAPKYAVVVALGPAKGCGAHSCAWVKVAYDGVEGWSKGAYFEIALIVEGTAVANTNVNLRAAPDFGGAVLAVIPAGGEAKLTGRQSYPWVSVSYNGKKGWVAAEYLNFFPPPQR